MKDVAIIASVLPARFELLERSLITWQTAIRQSGLDAHIYLYIEGASIAEAKKHIPVGTSISMAGGEERSGSHIKGWNYFQHQVDAKVYLFTHGEIMFPRDTISVAFANAQDDVFVAFKALWLPKFVTDTLNAYNWKNPEVLERERLVYDLDDNAHGSPYENSNVRNLACNESTTTFAYTANTAKRVFPVPDFGVQGADDPYHAGARIRLGIRNYTVMDVILVHQWHPSTWDGNQSLAVEDASKALNERFGG